MSGFYGDGAGSWVDNHIVYACVIARDDDAFGGPWGCDVGESIGVRSFLDYGNWGESFI